MLSKYGAGHQTRTTRVPIPDNSIEQAEQIAEKLRVDYSYDAVSRLKFKLKQSKRS